ncbi:Os04g0286333 [Oryza sativa Japonica Group]|uniref:Os04g0286333 protein n=1 Tax=Oryza sativa subsp. japonica TaxID=39947 RepID=A0A0P0W884_ORYSJ|nr:hypothetical protein EE612_022827 [Oryza sativa]BAS88396.1 Os04g0286333 [Oryza sativa Japonica Group]
MKYVRIAYETTAAITKVAKIFHRIEAVYACTVGAHTCVIRSVILCTSTCRLIDYAPRDIGVPASYVDYVP